MERVFAAILTSIDRRDEVSLEYGRYDGTIGLFCRFPDRLEHQVIEHLGAKYPNCSIDKIDESSLAPPAAAAVQSSAALLASFAISVSFLTSVVVIWGSLLCSRPG